MNLNELIQHIEALPLCNRCFREYLRWLIDRGIEQDGENPLLSLLDDVDGVERLKALEKLLHDSMKLLSLPEDKFVNTFGFKTDLLTDDNEKIHDILAELIVVRTLNKLGFQNCRKLPKFIKHAGERLSCADMFAENKNARYCVEVKTIRIESNLKPAPDPMTANWWGQMFRNNLITKIEDKNRKLITQLHNAKKHFDCDFSILAVSNRRLGPSSLLSHESCKRELESIGSKYQGIDFFLIVNYFGEVDFYPRLPT